jgi:hypothetical protein
MHSDEIYFVFNIHFSSISSFFVDFEEENLFTRNTLSYNITLYTHYALSVYLYV